MADKRPKNPLALAVLTLLFEEPMHPYQMSTTLKERAKEQSIKLNYGSLYAVVESLEKRGYVLAKETVAEGRRPERTVYAITESGTRLMDEWLRDLLANPINEFPQFEAALSLIAVLPPEDVIELLEKRLATQSANYAKDTALIQQVIDLGMPRLFAVEHEYEMALVKAEIDYVTTLLDDLKNDTISGMRFWRRMADLRAEGMPPEEIRAKVTDEFKEDFTWVEKAQEIKK
ncbi:MAG: PadR family transcriptional regulator [Acidimicrobiia bacterium]|nr:PadR family transcriptional regulator [Acidimicrobiia bacterium]